MLSMLLFYPHSLIHTYIQFRKVDEEAKETVEVMAVPFLRKENIF